MVTTRNMDMEDPTEMIRMLQQKLKEMQQRHKAEIATVRAECSAWLAKDKGPGAGEKAKGERGKFLSSSTISAKFCFALLSSS